VPFNERQVPTLKGDIKRVQTLLLDVIKASRAGAFSTKEDILEAYAQMISLLEGTIDSSIFEQENAVADTEPSIQWRNSLANGINQDLILLFFEMNQLATLMSGLFNQQVSEADDLIGRIKRIKT